MSEGVLRLTRCAPRFVFVRRLCNWSRRADCEDEEPRYPDDLRLARGCKGGKIQKQANICERAHVVQTVDEQSNIIMTVAE